MMQIYLNESQKNQIKEQMDNFISKKKILKKIDKLAVFLIKKDCHSTSQLLKSVSFSDFMLFGRSELQEYIKKFEAAFKSDSTKSGIDKETITNYILKGSSDDKVSGYSGFYKSFSQSDEAYKILDIINVRVCPYCNRQFTFTASKNGVKTRPQFDHFFPKTLYPYLAVSMFNLVPSCAICNCGKSDVFPKNVLYPYEESFESRNIRFTAGDIIPYLLGFEETIDISLESYRPGDTSTSDIIDEYNKCFKIKIIYEQHLDHIKNLIAKKAIFSDEAIKSICSSYSGILGFPPYLEQLIFGKYDTESLINHPLSKLTSDIWNQI